MKATPFGCFLRKLRIDLGINLKDFERSLGKSMAYFSAVELGRKNIPNELIDDICKKYSLGEQCRAEMNRLASISKPVEKIDLTGASEDARIVAALFSSKLNKLSKDELGKIKSILEASC